MKTIRLICLFLCLNTTVFCQVTSQVVLKQAIQPELWQNNSNNNQLTGITIDLMFYQVGNNTVSWHVCHGFNICSINEAIADSLNFSDILINLGNGFRFEYVSQSNRIYYFNSKIKYIIDGEVYSSRKAANYLNELSYTDIISISSYTKNDAKQIYGIRSKFGVINIKTL